jgi:hypothetical protein
MPWNAVMMPTTVPSSPTNGAAFLLELVFLQSGEDDLGEVAVTEVLRGGDGDRVLQPPLFEMLGDLRGIELRLLPGLRERVDALNGDAKRDHGHDDQDDADGLGHGAHGSPHFNNIHSPILRSGTPELVKPVSNRATAA